MIQNSFSFINAAGLYPRPIQASITSLRPEVRYFVALRTSFFFTRRPEIIRCYMPPLAASKTCLHPGRKSGAEHHSIMPSAVIFP